MLEESFSSGFKQYRHKNLERKKYFNKSIIHNVRPLIVQHWHVLKEQFRKEDKLGKTSITLAKAYAILESNHILSNETELHQLCQKFHTNGVDFNYVKFLNYFKSEKNENLSEFSPLLMNLITKLREKVSLY